MAVERLSCGLELSLPEGEYFETGDAVRRTVFRTRWWEHLRGKACGEVVFPPDRRISGAACSPPSWHRPYPETAKPVFFGHFAVSDEELAPIAPNVACLDYGMGKGGRLVAYRWDGEATLMREKFVTAH